MLVTDGSIGPRQPILLHNAMNLAVQWDIETASEWVTVREMEQAMRRVTTQDLRVIRWGLRQMLAVLFDREIVPNPQFDPFEHFSTLDPERVVGEDLAKDVAYLKAYVNIEKLIRYLPLLVAWGLAVRDKNRKPVMIYENP
jgi:hypothetical protein